MDHITEGPYQLRYVAPEDSLRAVDGLFATRIDGTGDPVIVGPRVPSLLQAENWWLEKTADSSGWHILGEGPLPTLEMPTPVKLGFSHDNVRQGAPIVVAEALGEYTIKALNHGEYAISAAAANSDIDSARVDYVVGVSDQGMLEIHEVDIHLDRRLAVPRWQIHKLE